VASRTSIPWLADFRDPWTQIDFYKDLKLTSLADARHRRLEKSVLQHANAVSVISPTMAEDFQSIFPRKYEVITNGYDEEDTGREVAEPDPAFSIAHIGTLTGTRNPVVLWQALKELLVTEPGLRNDLRIKLVGKVDHSVTTALGAHGLTEFTERMEYLPHNDVIRIQQASRVLLLLINNTQNSKGILTGKFFEYLAARRPILCIGPPDGDAAAILRQTNSGLISDFDDITQTRINIQSYYRQFRENSLSIHSRDIEQYSRKALTGKMALLMDSLLRLNQV